MKHRHLTHEEFTPAAVDDIISRGKWSDWAELRQAVLEKPALMRVVEQVCAAHIDDPYAQRYHFWKNYVQAHRATA